MHISMAVIETLAGGWTTSLRMHEAEQTSCIFGCKDARDNVGHYIMCNRLWRAVAHASRCVFSTDIHCRLAISASPQDIINLYVAFCTYHSVRFKYATDISQAAASRNFNALAAAVKGEACAAQRVASTNVKPLNRVTEPHFTSAIPARSVVTRFIQGGDHFMTTSRSSE